VPNNNNATEGMEAPGQLLTHYAPDKPAYITSFSKNGDTENFSNFVDIGKSVLIDFGGTLHDLRSRCLAYKDLSPSRDVNEAANVLFSALRWTETIEDAQIVLLPALKEDALENSDAVFDRIFRAASGRTAVVDKLQGKIFI